MQINFWKTLSASSTLGITGMTVGYLWMIHSMRERACERPHGDSAIDQMTVSIECRSILGYLIFMSRVPEATVSVVVFNALYFIMQCFGACNDSHKKAQSPGP